MRKKIFILCQNVNPSKIVSNITVWLKKHRVDVKPIDFENKLPNKVETPNLELYFCTSTIGPYHKKFDEIFGVNENIALWMKKNPYSESFKGSLREYLIQEEVVNGRKS